MRKINQIIYWLKARDLAEIALGCVFGSLATATVATVIQYQMIDVVNARAIENAQLQVAAAITEANRFRASIECTALNAKGLAQIAEGFDLTADGCDKFEPRVRP